MKQTLPFPVPEIEEINFTDAEGVAETHLDLAYAGQSQDQSLDLLIPAAGEAPWPLVIYIHEGAFAFGSKRDARIRSVLPVLKKGIAIASIDYRKSDPVTWPAQIYDAKAAVRYLRANAEKFHLDAQRFAVWGASAGAYIGSMLGVTGNLPAFEDGKMGNPEASSSVQAVIDWFGCCSGFHKMDGEIAENGFGRPTHGRENSPESIMMGNPLGEIPELCRLASPSAYVNQDIPPFLIQHGRFDPITPVQQSTDFAKIIEQEAGAEKVKLTIYEAGHNEASIYEMPAAQQEALDFLAEVFGR